LVGLPVTPSARIEQLNLRLPPPFSPVGTYVNAVRTGNLLVLGGHIPVTASGQIIQGKLGAELDVETGQRAARLAALSALSTMQVELGSLDRVVRIVSLRGLVNSTPDFQGHTLVIDGASDLLVEIFGDQGQHARLAVGVTSLPADLALEIELLAEVSR
jgi:enamine deaminase RidA (YjgF/YER057c/UK114 family)